MNELKSLHPTKFIVDEESGEIEYLTIEEYANYKHSKENHLKGVGDNTYYKSKQEFYKYIDEECGNFYFNYYNNNECANQYDFRFIYLCTFMNYENRLIFGNSKGESKLMKKKDLFEVLKLSKVETYKTIDYFEGNNLLTISDKVIEINDSKCIRGKIEGNKKAVVRMFDNTIKYLYETSNPKEHKKLALLIKILPYIHFGLNVVCKNPSETENKLIEPFSLTELAKELNYSTTQKLKKGLMDVKVNGEYVIMIAKIANKDMIVVNPKIYYKGNNLKEMKGIIALFDVVSK